MENYGTARQATCDTIIRGMPFACWIIKATKAHSEYVIFLLLYSKNICSKTPEYYVTLILPVFSVLLFWN